MSLFFFFLNFFESGFIAVRTFSYLLDRPFRLAHQNRYLDTTSNGICFQCGFPIILPEQQPSCLLFFAVSVARGVWIIPTMHIDIRSSCLDTDGAFCWRTRGKKPLPLLAGFEPHSFQHFRENGPTPRPRKLPTSRCSCTSLVNEVTIQEF